MRMYDLILKKRSGDALSDPEIRFFVLGFAKGEIPDYQVSAMMMAIYFRGMNESETLSLVKAMVDSGDKMDLSGINGIKVDKHSTGGVGDKTSLVVGPLVAAAGVPVAKMTGRGLGHTGGTIDKLESFPGFTIEMPEKTFFDQVNRIGIAFCGQTANLVPADKKLYALRDVTATVENLSLIAGSIMSKKIAGGADAIVLDVKCGSGAFMKTREDAFALAKEMVKIGNGMGRETSAVISSMEQPLGRAVGNSNEVTEAIETLLGKGPGDLRSLSLEVGARMLVAGKKAKDSAEGKNILEELIRNGKALGKFEELIRAQGGDSSLVTHPENFAKCTHSRDVLATQSGFVASIQAEQIGIAAMILGAGREKKEDIIDHSAGVYLHKKTGDAVQAGDALATFFTNRAEKINEASEKILQAYSLSTNEITPPPLILGFCDRSGIMELR